ncbi:MAG TPA: glycosyltransferase family 4 protein [Vulgatibacter sp.]|nr:glycosyltransferase family 4 protein [Vulgatibacter sp.]
MKILSLCATPEYTGPAELMLEDARSLRAAGHEVTVGFDGRREGTMRAAVEAAGLPIQDGLDLCRIGRPLPIARDVLALRRWLREGRYDTVHVRFSHDHHVVLLAMAGLDRRSLRLLRSCELLENVAPGWHRTFPFAGTDRFVVPSAEHAAGLRRHHGVARERIEIVRGRVDAARFSPGASGLRAELEIPAEAPVAGIVSRMKPDRRHPDLLAAFARALRQVPSAWLVVVGRGEGEPLVREAAEREGVAHRVRFAGYRSGDALADAYRAFDVKAWLASGNDGTCRAVLEAMASGCAVLGGAFGAVAESVVDGVTGRLCDPGDHEATGAALAWLLADRARAAALGEAGRRRVLALYTPERRASDVIAAYERAWAAPAPVPSHGL